MRILHVISGLGVGGAERALLQLLTYRRTERQDVQVVSVGPLGRTADSLQDLGITVVPLGVQGIRSLPRGLLRLNKLIGNFRPHLLHGWMYHGNLVGTLAVRREAKLVWGVRHCLYGLRDEKPVTRIVIRGNKALSNCPSAIVYNSKLSRKQHESFGFAGERGYTIPNGFYTSESVDPDTRFTFRQSLGIPDTVKVIGHIGRFHPMKDHALFLRAAVMLARSYPDTLFLMCGTGVDGTNTYIRERIPVDLRNRFFLLGQRDDVGQILNALDILCQSSWSESFPNVLGEAMAVGVPCVATGVGDSAEIVGDAGRIVPPRDLARLRDALITLLKLSPQERIWLGDRARRRIRDQFSIQTVVDQYDALYRDLVSEKA